MTLRVGVVGLGVMGADHVRTLTTRVSGAVVTAVADIDPVRAASVAGGVGARAFRAGQELISSDEVDAVLVAAADGSHTELTLAAIAAGRPVLTEKPLAPTPEECRQIAAAERAAAAAAAAGGAGGAGGAGRLVAVGFMRRFDPAHVALRDGVRSGSIGRVLLAHAVHRNTTARSGGTSETTVTGSAIHELDSVPWVLGSPVSDVSWHAPRAASGPRVDPQVLLVRTADGALVTVEVFVGAGYGYDVRLEVVGSRGTLALADPALLVRTRDLHRASDYPVDWRPRFAEAYRAELQAWVDAVVTGVAAPDLATAEDGLRAAEAARAAVTSMREGGVPVPVLQI